MPIKTLGLDADDTLWHNESVFHLTQRKFLELLGPFGDAEQSMARLLAVESRNLALYGYGIKGFTLSMIETAIELSGGRVPAAVIENILTIGREMLRHPVETLPDVEATLHRLRDSGYRLVLVTKGDLLDQEQKLARSGLGDYFDRIEIVSEKTAATYRRIFAADLAGGGTAAMIGNSLRSDILPAIEAGLWGIHIPYHLTWAHEHAEPPVETARFVQLQGFGGLLDWLERNPI